jgi:hypothetical protein
VDEELFKMDEIKLEVMRSRGAGGQVRQLFVEVESCSDKWKSTSTKLNLPSDSLICPPASLSLCKTNVVNTRFVGQVFVTL